ncbi:tryptophan 7-halogenase [Shewanella cyperi]|uniref:Tryptophan 7-halogenase n=1 Tax=Shewanella cyperi TaxID=2814292 RepID=A0A974XV67_9GAMM|nr:tryptophan halogenase family protein [Shewanella cyperi]QSX30879.1 tryptophan 7-halogenase [Shewanella cyperi]
MKISNIAIVGGGTAGWLTANHLGKALSHRSDISLTLIEAPDIPIIGVGEGTVPSIRQSLQLFGISETELIRQCDATFKQSIRFNNWRDSRRHGANFYHHLFDAPSPLGLDLTASWLTEGTGSYAGWVSPQHSLCEAQRAPKDITTKEFSGAVSYAYHFNAAKFAALLADNARTRFGVKHLQTRVHGARVLDDGAIGALETDQGLLEFDFYIDCSGQSAFLLGKILGVDFIDKSGELFVDSALTVQVPTAPDAEIPPYTQATAHQAGWIWDIALSSRRGVGLVYSGHHLDDSGAERKLQKYLGCDTDKLTVRKIPMRVGYRERFWHKNCVALGLAQGFLEPLEATSILLTDFAGKFLAAHFPEHRGQLPLLEQRFNKVMGYAWERVVEFIKLHYCLSDRTDSDFWHDNRLEAHMPTGLRERLALWRDFIPQRDDFFSKFEVFELESVLYVLYGMGFHSHIQPPAPAYLAQAMTQSRKLDGIAGELCRQLPSHRELIDKIHRYGMQKI